MSETAVESAPQTFDKIAPVVRQYARSRCNCCPDREAMALVIAWHRWEFSNRKDLPATVWARIGVRHAIAGRDIPGVRSKFRDAMKFRETQGAGMEGLADRRPGPVRSLIAREEFDKFVGGLDDFETEMCDLLANNLPNKEGSRPFPAGLGIPEIVRNRLLMGHGW